MLWGRYASRRSEARFPTLWDGRVFSICPSIQGPSATAYDTSGRGLHATRFTGTATKWTRSIGKTVLDYDTTYYSRVGMDLGRDSTISFAAWMFIRSTLRRSFASSGPSLQVPRLLIGVNASQKIELYTGGYTNSTGSFGLNQWVHIGVSCGGSGNLTTYFINGTQDSQVSQTYSNTSVQPEFYIGTGYNGTFDGLMDDVIIYNRILRPGEFRLLGTRRGISYEMRRDVVEGSSGFQAAWTRRQSQIIGGGT